MSLTINRLTAALGGSYRLEREIGAGGMATVYLAHDIKHDRDVAIKVLHPDLGAALGGERFLSEIRTTARLQHPHILPLLDSGDADGLLYYVMPLVTGETLRARLEREKQLPIADAVRIAREVASALDYAHRQNVIHRDIKLENILLHDGSALVADFGIALAVQSAGGARMTQTGLSLGTPSYMSPEQAMGERAIDARSDVYALGAMTYEMLAGEPPFTGPTVQAIVAKVMSTEPASIVSLRKAVPANVAAAVHSALEKLPADRCESAKLFSEMLSDTRGAFVGTTANAASATPAASSRTSHALIVGALAMAVVSMAVAAWSWLRPGDRESETYRIVPMSSSSSSGGAGALALSADATQYTERGIDSSGAPGVVLRSLVGAPSRVVYAGAVNYTGFSPDGRHLAFTDAAAKGLIVLDVPTGSVRKLATGGQTRGLGWLSNEAVATSNELGEVWRYGLDGAPAIRLYRPGADSLRITGGLATRNGYLVARASRPGSGLLVAIREDGQHVDSLYGPISGETRPSVVGDVLLFMDDGRLWGLPLARDGRSASGERRDLFGSDVKTDVVAYAASTSGSMIVVRAAAAPDRELIYVGRDGRSTVATSQRAPFRVPHFAPSGTQIANVQTAGIAGSPWIFDVNRGTLQRAGADSNVVALQWAPDGRRLYTATQFGRTSRVQSIEAAGGGADLTLLSRPNVIFELEVTPDGRTLVWREDAPVTGRDILMASLDRPTEAIPVRVSAWDERGIALSRDGKWLAYTSNESGGNDVYLCRLEPNGPRWAVSRGGGSEPRWGANGELFYRKQDSVFVLRVTGAETPTIGMPSLVAVVPSVSAPYEPLWDVRPDGQQFVMVRQKVADQRKQLLVLNWESRWREGVKGARR